MNKALLDIKVKYPTLSKAEKNIADFLMDNPSNILSLYITQLAEKCGASEATIVRFARKLGYNGYQQLKLALAQETGSIAINQSITEKDSAYDIFSKVCEDIYCSLEKTKSSLSEKALQSCCDKILSADKILILGLGNSASIAIDAAHKMIRLGLNASAYTDNHMQAIVCAHTNSSSMVIGISHSGHSKDIIQAMQSARDNGATTVSLTNKGKSPIDKVSDIILHTVSDETNYRTLGLSSRIAQLAIIDTLYSHIVCHLNTAKDHISKTEFALHQKKI